MDKNETVSCQEDSQSSESEPSAPALSSPGVEAVPDTFVRLEKALEKAVADIRSEIRERTESDLFRERHIEQLHAEVQSYRAGLLQQEAKQLMLGLVRLHDGVGKMAEAIEKRPPADLSPKVLIDKMMEFQDDIELLLAQHGVDRFEAPGDTFDPQRQTVLRTVVDPDPAKKGTMALRIHPGFSRDGKILQRERVAVFVLDPSPKYSTDGGNP